MKLTRYSLIDQICCSSDNRTYYNMDNGARINTRTKNYWGITRVGLSVVYRFNLKK